MRLNIVSSLICLTFFAFVWCADENKAENQQSTTGNVEILAYTEDAFNEEVEKKAHFVMFYAPWCGHCQRLKPVWEQLVQDINEDHDLDVVLAKVDCTAQTSLCSDQGVLGYPTLKFYRPEHDSIRHKGGRDLSSLKEFIKTSLLLEQADGALPISDQGLYELTNDNFEDHIATSKHFVMFFAPWCGHCKRLEPIWIELAKSKEPVDGVAEDVKIGRVDCTKQREVCGKYEVRGYPTLLWFEDGEHKQKYQGGRQLKNLEDFIKKMTNTDKVADSDGGTEPTEKSESGLYDLNAGNYVSHIDTGVHFIMFYAPWCGHCQRLEPVWMELAKLYQPSDTEPSNVKIGRVDCTANKDICSNNAVRGYPTLLWFKDGVKVKGYQGSRDIESLKNFINVMLMPEDEAAEQEEQEEVKEPVQPPPAEDDDDENNPVIVLDSKNFDFYTAMDVTFVMFYAPWCGFCKRLAPVWEELAVEEDLDLHKEVTIAKVDCTKHSSLCSKYEVQGYPTLIAFQDGEKLATYSGNRSKEDLKKFIVEQVTGVPVPDEPEVKPKEEL